MEYPDIKNPSTFDKLAFKTINTKFNGAIFFEKTKCGYKVQSFFDLKADANKVNSVYGFLQTVCIEGSFNFNPVRGQFCKRPHKLINWSKND